MCAFGKPRIAPNLLSKGDALMLEGTHKAMNGRNGGSRTILTERGILDAEPTLAGPFQGERMARREFQKPNVLRQEGPRPYWYIRYRRKVLVGKKQIRKEEKWHRLGYCDETTKRQAERARDEVLREVNREVYTIQTQVLFEDFVQIYRREHVPTLAPGPRQKYESLLDNHILPVFGGKRMCDIGTEEVQSFLNAKEKQGLSWWTRNDLKGILSGIFTKAADWGYWSGRNPAAKTLLGRKRPKRPKRILSDDQMRAPLAVLPAIIRLMVETAVSTGMRISEILGLKWSCVDLERGWIRVEERYYRGDQDEPKTEPRSECFLWGIYSTLTAGTNRRAPLQMPTSFNKTASRWTIARFCGT